MIIAEETSLAADRTTPQNTLDRAGLADLQDPLRALLRRRSLFVGAAASLLLAFNLLQPVLSVFTRALDGEAFSILTWGWVYAFAQFIVPLALLQIHVARARRFAVEATLLAGPITGGEAP